MGNFNNINQQNFGSQDLLGIASSGGRGGGGGQRHAGADHSAFDPAHPLCHGFRHVSWRLVSGWRGSRLFDGSTDDGGGARHRRQTQYAP